MYPAETITDADNTDISGFLLIQLPKLHNHATKDVNSDKNRVQDVTFSLNGIVLV